MQEHGVDSYRFEVFFLLFLFFSANKKVLKLRMKEFFVDKYEYRMR